VKILTASSVLLAAIGLPAALAQNVNLPPSLSMKMEEHGGPIADTRSGAAQSLPFDNFEGLMGDIPTNQLSNLAQNFISEAAGTTRSAKDVQIYRTISPSVVLIVNKEGLGSGALLDSAGDIITNWHVVKQYANVAVIFKPAVEGKEPTRDDMKLAYVVKYDEIADLALVKSSEVPAGRNPVRLGDSSEIAVGMDVHAIGHPSEAWTYTTGVISQYRQGYAWQAKGDPIKHKADIIQTQTPINPGNSGGPLISDAGNLIGINSFKEGGEGLNFAVSVDEVKRFLARPGSRLAEAPRTAKNSGGCKWKELSTFRNKDNNATVTSIGMFCTGKDTAEYVVPDKKADAIILRLDRNGDRTIDAIVFDFQRRSKWDLSFWDENFNGHWTLVGYHDDGSLKPTRFESYNEFQKRLASR
jgi:S1-C subfamily serine protease